MTDVYYDGEGGSVITDSGKLYVNIPVAGNGAATLSAAVVSDWSLLTPASTAVKIVAKNASDEVKTFTFTASVTHLDSALPFVTYGSASVTGAGATAAVTYTAAAGTAANTMASDTWIVLPEGVTSIVWQKNELTPVTLTFDSDSLITGSTYSLTKAYYKALSLPVSNAACERFNQMVGANHTFALTDGQAIGSYEITLYAVKGVGTYAGGNIAYSTVSSWARAAADLTFTLEKS
ncbi:hypothetical protein [Papillibacter cinnamivorans]|uniref:hypothetical protein n=1 Tax=Papillibacter cinnamivorans TaxID=100176 RepID=UPI000A072FF8|nr:hypothetical protein [Papillibacter cinnamivorans]